MARTIFPQERPGSLIGGWLGAIVMVAVSAGLWFYALGYTSSPASNRQFFYVTAACATLPAVLLVVGAAWLTLTVARFGHVPLRLPTRAPRPGQTLRGNLEISKRGSLRNVSARLVCYEEQMHRVRGARRSGSGKSALECWSLEKTLAILPAGSGARVELEFDIPDHLPGTTISSRTPWHRMDEDRPYHRWELQVTADIPGVDLHRTYEIPVAPPSTAAAPAFAVAADASQPDAIRAVASAKQTIGPRTGDAGGEMLVRRPGTTAAFTGPAAIDETGRDSARKGSPVVLADQRQLLRTQRLIGVFLSLWGVGFAGIPAVLLFVGRKTGTAVPILQLCIVAGLAAAMIGCLTLARRKIRRFVPEGGHIEQLEGTFRLRRTGIFPVAPYDRVELTGRFVSYGRGNQREIYDIRLAGASEHARMSLGSYSNRNAALAAAMGVAGAVRRRLVDNVSGHSPVIIPAEQLPTIPAGQAGAVWWRRPSVQLLVAANLVPVWGVLYADWELLPVMVLFWAENLIIGLYNVLKMVASARAGTFRKISMIPFFIVHYGGFCLLHGVLVMRLFGGDALEDYGEMRGFMDPGAIRHVLAPYAIWVGVIALAVSHGFSYVRNYLGAGEYRDSNPGSLMYAPYARVVVMHVVVIIGGVLLMELDSLVQFVVLLVVLKTTLDVHAHLREHAKHPLTAHEEMGGAAAGAASARLAREQPGMAMTLSVALPLMIAIGAAVFLQYPPPAQDRESSRPRLKIATGIEGAPEATRAALAPIMRKWQNLYGLGLHARRQNRPDEARRLLEDALAYVNYNLGRDHPAAAYTLVALAEVYERNRMPRRYERSLVRALDILDRHSDAEAKRLHGKAAGGVDKDRVAHMLGAHYWNRRRYERAFEYYERAYRAALAMEQITEDDRNEKLAYSVNGMMAAACMAGNFDAAEAALQDLRQRTEKIDQARRRQFEHWIRSGESRIRNRKC